MMKKAWCPKTAEKALIDTVKLCGPQAESNAAEMISAMAGGWKSKLIVEAWSNNCGAIASSIGLAIAAHHTGGRHVCFVTDEFSKLEYTDSMRNYDVPMPEVVVGARCEFLESLASIDFLVIQGEQDEFMRLFGRLKLCHHGTVLAWKDATFSAFRWQRILDGGLHVVRSFALPSGLVIAQVASANRGTREGQIRWIRHINQHTGEMHILRR